MIITKCCDVSYRLSRFVFESAVWATEKALSLSRPAPTMPKKFLTGEKFEQSAGQTKIESTNGLLTLNSRYKNKYVSLYHESRYTSSIP